MFRIIFTMVLFMTILSTNAQTNYLENDTVICFLLREDMRNANDISRAQMILDVKYNPHMKVAAKTIDVMLDKLIYIKDLPYNSDEWAMEWVVPADTLLALKSMTPPVRALIVRYHPKPKNRKYYGIPDLKELIWVTDKTVEIGNREYRLSTELKQFLFGPDVISN